MAQLKVQAAIEMARTNGRPPRIIVLKARQVGISTFSEGALFHDCHMRPGRTALVLAHKLDSAKMLFRMTKRFLDLMPDRLKPATAYCTRTEIEFADNGSRLQVEVASEGGGRGFTAQNVHGSEVAFWPDPSGTLAALLQAVPDTPDSLVVLESTPNGKNDFFEMWTQAVQGKNDFIPIFVPWFEDPTYTMDSVLEDRDLDEEEQHLKAKFELTFGQLQWRRWAIRNKCKNDPQVFAREYPSDPVSCFALSGRAIFERKSIEYYMSMIPPQVPEESLPPKCDIVWDDEADIPVITNPWQYGPLRIHTQPISRHLYIAGVDCSEGDEGSDPTPIVVTDRMTLEPVAVWHGRARPDLLAHKARALCVYYNNAHCIWEANHHGLAFQITFEQLYDDFYMRETSIESTARRITDKAGFFTSTKTRAFLFDVLRRFIGEQMAPIRDPLIVHELSNVYYDERGLVKKYSGQTMDLLIAFALTLEAHRGDPTCELAPLSPENYQELDMIKRRHQVALSMGIASEMGESMSRIGATARDLEDLDELDHFRKQRQRRSGVGEME